MTPLSKPFIKTTKDWSHEAYAGWVRHGYDAVTFQAQNDTLIKDFDLNLARGAGLRAEVWGVTYGTGHPSYQPDAGVFYRDGKALGQQAVKLHATDAVTMNAENCAKFTRSGRLLRPIIAGLRDGGWAGPVHLNTLGCPSNPDVNDFEMDIESFLETGGGVAAQAYYNAHEEYLPELCAQYWRRMGVPEGMLSLTLGLYDPTSENPGRKQLSGADYVPLVKAANIGQAISIFMPETMFPNDLAELEAITLPSGNGGGGVPPIGQQDGIKAAVNRLRDLDPAGTLLVKADGKWPDISTLESIPIGQWKAFDKLQRTLQILKDDHDSE
jgi:hypothetical protein